MKEIKNAYLREAEACFPDDDVLLPPDEDKSKVITQDELFSTKV